MKKDIRYHDIVESKHYQVSTIVYYLKDINRTNPQQGIGKSIDEEYKLYEAGIETIYFEKVTKQTFHRQILKCFPELTTGKNTLKLKKGTPNHEEKKTIR